MLVSQMETHVLLAAAGSGRRMGADVNKQFLEVDGLPVVIHAVRRCKAFLDSLPEACLRGLHLICAEEELETMDELLKTHGLRDAVTSLVPGGRTRPESVYRGLTALVEQGVNPAHALVMIHDAARCLTTPSLFAACRASAVLYGASCPGLEVQDTLRKAIALEGQEPVLYETVPRHMLYRMQTPQCFRMDEILQANRVALERFHKGELQLASLTDDVSIAQLAGITVRMVKGEPTNLKLTRPEDLFLAEAYIKAGLV